MEDLHGQLFRGQQQVHAQQQQLNESEAKRFPPSFPSSDPSCSRCCRCLGSPCQSAALLGSSESTKAAFDLLPRKEPVDRVLHGCSHWEPHSVQDTHDTKDRDSQCCGSRGSCGSSSS